MGEVWAAQRGRGGGRWVAVKLLKSTELGDRSLSMFVDEARTATALRHPHIVPTFESGVERGAMFIAMELIRGPSLQSLIKRLRKAETPIPVPCVGYVGLRMAQALTYAANVTVHGKVLGLIHRDVSPHNILLNTQGRAFLSDFGVARSSYQEHETLGGEIRGKPGYMSPEQVNEEPLDARSDIFALGIVLWEMATRKRLFKRDTLMRSMMAVANETAPPVASLRPELTPELAAIIDRCLRPERGERYQDSSELVKALAEVEAESKGEEPEALLSELIGQVFDVNQFDPDHRASSLTDTDADLDVPSSSSSFQANAGAEDDEVPTQESLDPLREAALVSVATEPSVAAPAPNPIRAWQAGLVAGVVTLGLTGWWLTPGAPEEIHTGGMAAAVETPAKVARTVDGAKAHPKQGPGPGPSAPPEPSSGAAPEGEGPGDEGDADVQAPTLVRAARRNDLSAMAQALESEPVDGRGDGGWTALHTAAQRGHVRAAGWLLERGADVDLTTQDMGRTALMLAARYGDEPMLKRLLEAGADVGAQDRMGDRALHLAVSDPARPVRGAVIRLVRAGADLEATGQQGHTPLVRAIVQDHKSGGRALLEAGADPNRSAAGAVPLVHAAGLGRAEWVDMLLKAGAEKTAAAAEAAEAAGHSKLAAKLR